jgi:hypothetical protein
MYLARNAVIAGYYADNDLTARIRGSGTPRSGFVQLAVPIVFGVLLLIQGVGLIFLAFRLRK